MLYKGPSKPGLRVTNPPQAETSKYHHCFVLSFKLTTNH